MEKSQIAINLLQFTGTENYYRASMLTKNLMFTDGVHFLCEECNCYWIVDTIVSCQMIGRVRAEDFQVWILTVKDDKAIIKCEDGDGKVVYVQEIEYTDFPLDEIKLYFRNNIIHLPSEN